MLRRRYPTKQEMEVSEAVSRLKELRSADRNYITKLNSILQTLNEGGFLFEATEEAYNQFSKNKRLARATRDIVLEDIKAQEFKGLITLYPVKRKEGEPAR